MIEPDLDDLAVWPLPTANRIPTLTEAAHRLAVGGSVDLAWVRVQLLDLRDLLQLQHLDDLDQRCPVCQR